MNNYHNELVKIGLNIIFYRKHKGFTQLKLTELTEYSVNHIQQIETAKVSPSVKTLFAISKVL